MAIPFGELLAGAGRIGRRAEAVGQELRDYDRDRLALAQLNRQERLRQEMLGAPMPQASASQFSVGEGLPVIQTPTAGVPATPATGAGAVTPAVAGSSFRQALPGMGVTPVTSTPMLDAAQQGAPAGLNLNRFEDLELYRPAGTVYGQPRGPASTMGEFIRNLIPRPSAEEQRIDPRTGKPVRRSEFVPSDMSTPRGPSTPTPTAKSAKAASAYDNKVTPYDAVIQQSAAQYGIDPVVFKRLIGTESSFNPTAVSPRGERFGLGIAQIADVHGLSREQMLDPNTAIPFAAQLFAQYLQQAGGNYEEALLRYKGASSEKGKAAMAAPIETIMAGVGAPTTQTTEAATPTAPVTTVGTKAPTATQVKSASEFYLANPQSIPQDMQVAMQQRSEVERLAGMYQRAGMGLEFMQTRSKLMEIDNNMMYLQGMQGMQEMALANDPRRLAAVWSQYAGVPVGIQPRTDGNFDVLVNGQRTKTNIAMSEIVDTARSAFDAAFRQQKSAASSKYNEEAFKTQLEIQKNNAQQVAQMIREVAVERVKGNNAQALEWLKANAGWDIKPSNAGDGTFIIRPPGASPFIFNPSGKTIEIDGVKVQSNAAYPIAGLPSYGGAPVR